MKILEMASQRFYKEYKKKTYLFVLKYLHFWRKNLENVNKSVANSSKIVGILLKMLKIDTRKYTNGCKSC